MRNVNLNVGMSRCHSLHALGRGDERQKLNFLVSSFLNEADSGFRGSARCQSGIDYDARSVDAVFGKFAILFVRFERLLVAVKPDMTDFRGGEECG